MPLAIGREPAPPPAVWDLPEWVAVALGALLVAWAAWRWARRER